MPAEFRVEKFAVIMQQVVVNVKLSGGYSTGALAGLVVSLWLVV